MLHFLIDYNRYASIRAIESSSQSNYQACLTYWVLCIAITMLESMFSKLIETGDLVYVPPRDGPTLWEIGFPNRSASEFYVPDPNPMYINKLYVNHPDRFALNNKTF